MVFLSSYVIHPELPMLLVLLQRRALRLVPAMAVIPTPRQIPLYRLPSMDCLPAFSVQACQAQVMAEVCLDQPVCPALEAAKADRL